MDVEQIGTGVGCHRIALKWLGVVMGVRRKVSGWGGSGQYAVRLLRMADDFVMIYGYAIYLLAGYLRHSLSTIIRHRKFSQ